LTAPERGPEEYLSRWARGGLSGSWASGFEGRGVPGDRLLGPNSITTSCWGSWG